MTKISNLVKANTHTSHMCPVQLLTGISTIEQTRTQFEEF